MALSPKFTVSFDCEANGFSIIQLTGVYDASTNTGGYGAPNIDTGDVDSTELVVEDLLNDITFDSITTLSAVSTYSITEFTIEDLLVDGVQYYDETIADGVFSFTFKVVDGATTYQYNVRKLYIPDLSCALATLMMRIVDDECGCVDKEMKDNFLLGFAYVESLKGASICGDLDKIQSIYDKTNTFLTNLNCDC